MPDSNARERLLDFLDKRAFDPVLNTSPDDYSDEGERKKLRDVQQTTRSTQQRYHDSYSSAGDVRANFEDDLSSDAAEDVHRDLRDLGLPTLNDVEDDFKTLADDLGIQ